MRYLLDTNIFLFSVIDRDSLSRDVQAILEDYENILYISMESVKELIVAYNNKKFLAKYWESSRQMVNAISRDFGIEVLPVDMNVMRTYADLELDHAEDHNDPSDHVIIAQSIATGIPLISSDRKFPYYRQFGLNLVYNER